MKRILKIMSIFLAILLVVGCGTSKSVTQQLAGEYANYDKNGNKEFTIVLEGPKDKDDTSGKATYTARKHSYYGIYEVYEDSKVIIIKCDEGLIIRKFKYDLDKETLSMDDWVFEKE